MKMKTIAIVAVLQLAFTFTASADYLRWQVPTSGMSVTKLQDSYPSTITWNTAVLRYADSADAASPYNSSGSLVTSLADAETSPMENGLLENNIVYGDNQSVDSALVTQSTFAHADVAANLGSMDVSSKFFFIELYDAQNELVGYSKAVSGATLTSLIDATRLPTDYASVNGWAPTNFVSVPEPTGALLMLMGMGLLGLRRRRLA